jgi:hypothetical protein
MYAAQNVCVLVLIEPIDAGIAFGVRDDERVVVVDPFQGELDVARSEFRNREGLSDGLYFQCGAKRGCVSISQYRKQFVAPAIDHRFEKAIVFAWATAASSSVQKIATDHCYDARNKCAEHGMPSHEGSRPSQRACFNFHEQWPSKYP